MILAVGTDIVEVARIAKAMDDPRFIERILTERERLRPLDPLYVAGRWAVKEAISKCIPGLNRWHDVEVLNDSDGRPIAHLSSKFSRVDECLHVSISHEKSHAVAIAVLESR